MVSPKCLVAFGMILMDYCFGCEYSPSFPRSFLVFNDSLHWRSKVNEVLASIGSITSFTSLWFFYGVVYTSFYHFRLPHKLVFIAIYTDWPCMNNTEEPTILWCNCSNKSQFNKFYSLKSQELSVVGNQVSSIMFFTYV